jgi:hypothetical protein
MLRMGKEDFARSRTLPRLLAFTLVACGGRYVSQGSGGGGTVEDPDGTSLGGSSSIGAGGKVVSGGAGASKPPTSHGGKASGAGGMALGGFPSGGTGFVAAGTFGIAGTFIGEGGDATGSGGSNPDADNKDAISCKIYCGVVMQRCPDRDAATCFDACKNDLRAASSCRASRRADYDCIATEFQATDLCDAGVYSSSKFCGAIDARPAGDCGQNCGIGPISGDAMGCNVETTCSDSTVDLRCTETAGPPLCACYIGGRAMRQLKTDANSAKAGCDSEALRLQCVAILP